MQATESFALGHDNAAVAKECRCMVLIWVRRSHSCRMVAVAGPLRVSFVAVIGSGWVIGATGEQSTSSVPV